MSSQQFKDEDFVGCPVSLDNVLRDWSCQKQDLESLDSDLNLKNNQSRKNILKKLRASTCLAHKCTLDSSTKLEQYLGK